MAIQGDLAKVREMLLQIHANAMDTACLLEGRQEPLPANHVEQVFHTLERIHRDARIALTRIEDDPSEHRTGTGK